MIAAMPVNNLTPQELWDVLAEHNLLSNNLLENPSAVANMAQRATFYVLHDEDTPLGLLLEIVNQNAKAADLALVPHDRGLGKRRNEVAELGLYFRERWFSELGLNRIQASVPASRVNAQRFFRSMGFVEETRRGVGLRNAVSFGKKPEAMQIWGLLPTDTVRVWKDEADIAHNEEGVSVG